MNGKTGKHFYVRDVVLVDKEAKVNVSLYDGLANITEAYVGKVMFITNSRVSVFNTVTSLNSSVHSTVSFDLPVTDTRDLKSWFAIRRGFSPVSPAL